MPAEQLPPSAAAGAPPARPAGPPPGRTFTLPPESGPNSAILLNILPRGGAARSRAARAQFPRRGRRVPPGQDRPRRSLHGGPRRRPATAIPRGFRRRAGVTAAGGAGVSRGGAGRAAVVQPGSRRRGPAVTCCCCCACLLRVRPGPAWAELPRAPLPWPWRPEVEPGQVSLFAFLGGCREAGLPPADLLFIDPQSR